MQMKSTACSFIGSRENNEDNLLLGRAKYPACLNDTIYVFESKSITVKRCINFAVCDGMGGCAKGEKASLKVIKTLFRLNRKEPGSKDWTRINNLCIKKLPESGTTCSMVSIRQNEDKTEAHFQSIGDSLIYHFKRSSASLELVNQRDNKAAELIASGKAEKISEKEMRYAEAALTNYIGKETVDEVTVHSYEEEIQDGDKIIIASDGISHLTEEEIRKALFRKNCGDNKALSVACAAVNSAGNHSDNTTVIVLEFWK